ncbi:hypothetical protein QE152_g5552 [Popillia japonica]|uniref:Uncharacterized protein n=1 Tax=Popillia japonica TaxID=7064 RepID=A0AAW1MKF8_POPJA
MSLKTTLFRLHDFFDVPPFIIVEVDSFNASSSGTLVLLPMLFISITSDFTIALSRSIKTFLFPDTSLPSFSILIDLITFHQKITPLEH